MLLATFRWWEASQGGREPGQLGLNSVETSQHQIQPCCLDNGSCPRHPRHPQGQLVSVGEGFYGGGPKGVHQGLGKNKGQQDLSPLS